MSPGDLLVAASVLSVGLLAGVFLYRRFRRRAADVPPACQIAAASALVLGFVTMIAGVVHSVAVASLAVRVPEYEPLQVLWLTTGAMLVYTGTMNAALYDAIRSGRRIAIAVAAGASSLFIVYLLLVQPLAGGGETVPPMLALWSLHLLSLTAAGIAAARSADRARRTANAHDAY